MDLYYKGQRPADETDDAKRLTAQFDDKWLVSLSANKTADDPAIRDPSPYHTTERNVV